jgi:peptidoglycan/LPS O-acetylase OafA/YrhL
MPALDGLRALAVFTVIFCESHGDIYVKRIVE